MKAADRWAALAERVLIPLLAGGEVRPIAPLGARFTEDLEKAPDPAFFDERVNALRAESARALVPVDDAPPFGVSDWLLLAALNDLLQAANPSLRWKGLGRVETVLSDVARLVASAGPPASVREALARHASFSRIREVERTDTRVSWWSGARTWVGVPPPDRVLAWSTLRRVRVEPCRLSFFDMGPAEAQPAYRGIASRWLAATPLTDVMTFGHWDRPRRWSGALSMLVREPLGRRLFARAALRADFGVIDALEQAAGAIDPECPDDRHAADAAVRELRALERLGAPT